MSRIVGAYSKICWCSSMKETIVTYRIVLTNNGLVIGQLLIPVNITKCLYSDEVTVWYRISADVIGPYFFKDDMMPPSPLHPTSTSTCWDQFLNPTWMFMRIFRTRKFYLHKTAPQLILQDLNQWKLCERYSQVPLRGGELNWPARFLDLQCLLCSPILR